MKYRYVLEDPYLLRYINIIGVTKLKSSVLPSPQHSFIPVQADLKQQQAQLCYQLLRVPSQSDEDAWLCMGKLDPPELAFKLSL